MSQGTRRRLLQVTQRLDHMVPDVRVSPKANAEASRRLEELCARLSELLPDPSLSPDERLERIARVVQDRVPQSANLLPAIEKVHRLERRLEELVPDQTLGSGERLEHLVSQAERMKPQGFKSQGGGAAKGEEFVRLLERLGDARAGFPPTDSEPRERA